MDLFILDSDLLSLHQRGHEPLRQRLSRIPPDKLAITIISAEELLRGRFAQVRRADNPERRVQAYYWLHKTFEYLCAFHAIDYDIPAETWYSNFRKQKIRVGSNDLKIAAIAMSRNAVVVTRNRQDFESIPSLRITDWS